MPCLPGVAAGLGVTTSYLIAVNVFDLGLLQSRTAATSTLVVIGLYLVLALEATSTLRARLVGLLCAGLLAVYVVVLAPPRPAPLLRARDPELGLARCSSFSGPGSRSASSGSRTTASSRCEIGRADPPGYDGVMAVSTSSSLDSAALRADFPFLEEQVDGKPLAYLDSASSTQKPRQVLDRMRSFYEHEYANVHRGVYRLAERATEGYEGARRTVAAFVNAPSEREVIFTRSATEAINLVAYAWGLQNLGPGDTVVITELEHHANFVPWQFIASKTGASFRHIPIDDAGELQLDALDGLAREGSIKVVATGLVSNSLGTINPVERLAAWAHEQGAIMVVDAAQAAPHRTIDVQALGCDFLAFSSHKLCGPSGVGALWGRRELLEAMEPFNLGGEMIRSVEPRAHDLQRAPAQVRGRHACDRRGGRLRRGDRLHQRDRPARDRAARARADGLRARAAGRARVGAALRPACRAAGRDRLVRGRGRASARRGPDPRLGGRLRSRRAPLHAAVDDAPRRRGDDPRELLPVLGRRGDRPPRRGLHKVKKSLG